MVMKSIYLPSRIIRILAFSKIDVLSPLFDCCCSSGVAYLKASIEGQERRIED